MKASWIKDLVLITLIVGIFFGATLGRYPLAAPDGARYAEIPREMVVTGDYLTPRLNGVKYFEKPPLFYWLQALSIKKLGANEMAASLANAFMALGCVLLVYLTGRKLYGRMTGIISSFVFATSALVFALTRVVTLDVTLTFFITGSLCSFLLANQLPFGIKRNLWLLTMYIFAAGAVMSKGLVGIIFLGLILAIWLTIFGKWRELKTYNLISGGIIFLLLTLPWHILVQLKNPEFFSFYFFEQHFLRYFTLYAGRSQKWWFLPAVSLVGLYPWVTFLPQTVFYNFPKKISAIKNHPATVFLFIWIAAIYVFYTFSHSQLIPYIFPIFPPLAILTGKYIAENWQKTRGNTLGFYSLAILNFILAAAAIIATFILDFNEQAFTKLNLYIVAAIITAGTLLILFAYRRQSMRAATLLSIVVTAILWLYISPRITTINRQSIKPLITTMQQKLTKEDEVMCYGAYYQELPFYLQRIVTVAAFKGELGFGTRHEDTSAWMIDQKTFWERWKTNRTIYLILNENDYRILQPQAPDKMRIIDKLWDTLLVVNSK